MLTVTIMMWFELENGELRFKDFETKVWPEEAQSIAAGVAALHHNGQCKIFDNKTERVIASAGF